MSKIHILRYKNFSNRYAKRLNTLEEAQAYIIYELDNVQFNRNDGINTSLVLNTDTAEQGDYLLVSENNSIISRWYIIENKWNRTGQVILNLRRDVIVDLYDEIISSDCIIERAMLNADDPLIFNSEPFSVNQIKSSETLLKDETGCPWIVAYVAKDAELTQNAFAKRYKDESIFVDAMFKLPFFYAIKPGQTKTCRANMPPATRQLNFYVNAAGDYGHNDGAYYKYTYRVTPTNIVTSDPSMYDSRWPVIDSGLALLDASTVNNTGRPIDYLPPSRYTQSNNTPVNATNIGIKQNMNPYDTYNLMTEVEKENSAEPFIKQDMVDELKALDGKVYCYPAGESTNDLWNDKTYVRYKVEKLNTELTMLRLNNTTGFSISSKELYNNMRSAVYGNGVFDDQLYADHQLCASIIGEVTYYKITCEILHTTFAINPKDRYTGANGNYDIICSPFGDISVNTQNNGTIVNSKTDNLLLYQSFANLNAEEIYDIQILPYCPARKGYIDNNMVATSYKIINIGSNDAVVINVKDDTSSFSIGNIIAPELNNAAIKKRNIITEKYRLCDPGYNGVFEFSVEANGGVDRFNVDMTVKPYNPFIHIAPNFKNLYGADYNDARGLTLGSNFSITTTSSKWAEFELNNKNYKEMFNRQIQNLVVQHDIQDIEGIFGAITGTASGAASGAAGGMLFGGVPGAIAGAVGGGVLSGIGGIADYAMLQLQQKEQLDFARDNFRYQLDNIKALPDSLTRIGNFNNIFKWFPYIEYYTCTDKEKEIIDKYIEWQSMNVNAIGKISDYIKPNATFIKAIPLRLNVDEDASMAYAISEELTKGIYI